MSLHRDLESLPFDQPTADQSPPLSTARPRRHRHFPDPTTHICLFCLRFVNPAASRRGRTNRQRGGSWEREFAELVGGRRMGQLNLPWDVECPGYLRAQTKQLDRWPSLAAVIAMLDAIPVGAELRAVALKDTPGTGHKPRRLLIVDASEYASWHGRAK